MKIVTRFAPSPTGNLHIGSARTALFNWLFAKNIKGKFLLRIEDTDKVRSTKESINKILDGLTWLNLQWDDQIIYQSKNQKRHKEVAEELLKKGLAYKCFCSEEDLNKMREEAKILKKPFRYNRMWREKNSKDAPQNIKPVIRIKPPIKGETIIEDIIQGTIKVSNEEIDDFIILRSDGTPTYMLSVIVDDYDMKVTHLIRGHDHLTNTFRQNVIYEAMQWNKPITAHIPLILGSDGSKMSKRHGAIDVEEYKTKEDRFFLMLYDYIGFLSALKINRAGLNSLNVKKFQFNETKDKEFILPIVKCTLHNTKNKKRIADVIEPWFVDQYYPKLMSCKSDDYIFMPEEKNRSKLYERIRKNFVRISSELGLYEFNGKTRPMYSIRHMNALKLYEDLKDVNLVAQALNTSPEIVKSNYLNYSDEWSRNRFRVLGYDKRALPQSSMKSKNKVSDK